MVDFQVELYDGSYHSVDSSEQAFKMAGIQAFNAVASKCKPVLLEPLDEVEVVTPDDYMGDILGDLSSRRAHILGTEPADGRGTRIRAVVPQAELHTYASSVQSMTQGRASFHMGFSHYEEVPKPLQEKIISEAKKKKEEDAEAH
jgi:elongation factor G